MEKCFPTFRIPNFSPHASDANSALRDRIPQRAVSAHIPIKKRRKERKTQLSINALYASTVAYTSTALESSKGLCMESTAGPRSITDMP